MQFDNSGEGGMQIGAPAPAVSNPQYENPEAINEGLRHGFANQGMVWCIVMFGVMFGGVMWCGV